MRKEFMLSFANIRKTKGQSFSLLIMFLIAALLLHAGMLILINFGSSYDKTKTELKASDMYILMPSSLYSGKVDNYLKSSSTIVKMQKEKSIRVDATIPYNNDKRDCSFLLNDADTNRDISQWKFVGEHLKPDSMSIYVPYILSVDGRYKLNDKLKMTINHEVLTFNIKGFTDDIFFSSMETQPLGAYLPHQTFEKIKQSLGSQYDETIVFANMSKADNSIVTTIKNIAIQEKAISASDADNAISSIDSSLIKLSRTIMANMISAMTVAFAMIIALVCLIVVRFRISNSIEDDMLKIGSLKALGYTSRQIIISVVLQFSSIAFIGCVVGILLSYSTVPALSQAFAHQSGIMWVQGFDGTISCITLLSVLAVVALVSALTAGRIRGLNPIVALRGGIVTHSFRKNYFPLDRAKGSLSAVLALKSLLQNKKSSIMIAVILAFVAFGSAFSVVMFYNSTVDTIAFKKTPGYELSNAAAYISSNADNTVIANEIKQMSGVRKAQFIDEVNADIDGTSARAFVMDDYAHKETNSVYEGRYPRHDNEVAVAGALAQILHKKIGDTVTVKTGEKSADYIITGLSQGSYYGGINLSVTRDGLLRINPGYKQQLLHIYLNKGVKSDKFVSELNRKFGKSLQETVDMDKSFQLGVGEYTAIVAKVGIVTFVTNLLVVILVLYFVINSSIVRRRRELGIQKALGYTTIQLMNQVSLGFLPPVIIGTVVGSLLGTQSNAVMSVAMRSMSIMKAEYVITPGLIALFGAAIVVFSYVISMLITCRIRKISAYALVSE